MSSRCCCCLNGSGKESTTKHKQGMWLNRFITDERMALSRPVLSTGSPVSYDQHFLVGNCTFGEQARMRMKDKSKKEQQREMVLQHVCALLNSGGGVLTVGIENKDFNYDTMGLGEDMEEHLTKLVDPSVIEDLIEARQCGNALQLYVKSWCPNGQGARICSVNSGLRERSGTTTPHINCNAVIDFIKRKNRNPFYEPHAKRPKLQSEAEVFYDTEDARLNQSLDFGESANVELKSFDRENNLEKRLKENLPKYLSAFGNTKGGFLFVGVDDKTKRVVGCGQGMDSLKIEEMVHEICKRAKARAVHLLNCTKKQAWTVDYKVFNVKNSSNEEPRYIIALKIQAFCCAVFEDDPKSWHVEGDTITQLNPSSWLEKMQLSDPDCEWIQRFESVLSLKDSPPQCRPVYSTQNIAKLQERIFSVQGEDINRIWESIPQELSENYPNLLHFCPVESKKERGILIMSTSWAVDINLPRNKAVICEALLIATGHYPTLFSWVDSRGLELWQDVSKTALNLKQKLVNLGGYTGRLCVIPHLVDCQTGELIPRETDGAPPYPESYVLHQIEEVVALLQSLTTVVLSFTSPLSDTLGCEFFNLLTEEQFNILHFYSGIKHLFIHGPPGSGKTLIAMEKIWRIKNSDGCENTEILYLCENVGLRDFVRKQSICSCETRAYFMKTPAENFASVKHIIVDEGQNFRLEHGDWYKKAKSLVRRNHGVFWVFVDYYQKSHNTKDGLPSLIDQENQIVYLSKVVRNSEDVYKKMSELIDKIASNSESKVEKHLQNLREKMELSHSFKGGLVIKMGLLSVDASVVQIVKELLQQGYSARDIAVLYSTAETLTAREYNVKKERFPVQFGGVEEVDQDVVVLDTIRRFSGLERNIVILVDPGVHPFQAEIEYNILLSAYSRARIRLYVLFSRKNITGSSDILKKIPHHRK